MPSPFPGMDPYLEDPAWWPDFHTRFVNALSEAIADRLPAGYQAALNGQVLLIEPDRDDNRQIEPDVAVVRHSDAESPSRSSRSRRRIVEGITQSASGMINPLRRPRFQMRMHIGLRRG